MAAENKTTIKTPYSREVTVTKNGHSTWISLQEINPSGRKDPVSALLPKRNVTEVVEALLGNNSVVIGDLPEVTLDQQNYAIARGSERHITANPDNIEDVAVNLLAIAKFIRKTNAEKEAAEAKKVAEAEAAAKAEKAREDELEERRDKIAEDLSGIPGYYGRTTSFKKAIDRIIELEDAAKLPKKFSL